MVIASSGVSFAYCNGEMKTLETLTDVHQRSQTLETTAKPKTYASSAEPLCAPFLRIFCQSDMLGDI